MIHPDVVRETIARAFWRVAVWVVAVCAIAWVAALAWAGVGKDVQWRATTCGEAGGR